MNKLFLISMLFSLQLIYSETLEFRIYVPEIKIDKKTLINNIKVKELLEVQGFKVEVFNENFLIVENLDAKKICNRIISWYQENMTRSEGSYFFNIVLWLNGKSITLCTTDPNKYIVDFSFFSDWYIWRNGIIVDESEIVPDYLHNQYIEDLEINKLNYLDKGGFLRKEYFDNRELISAFIFKGYLVGYSMRFHKMVISE